MSKPRVLVVAHDAGGANILASIIMKYRLEFCWHVAAAGPATHIFAPLQNVADAAHFEVAAESLASVIESSAPDVVLTGTGWQTRVELDAIRLARERAVPVWSYIDHWVNYRERFGDARRWRANLPDRVLVGDKYAYEIARADSFPIPRLIRVENPYLQSFISSFARPQSTSTRHEGVRILFLSEPGNITFPGQSRDAAPCSNSEHAIVDQLVRLISGPLAREGHLTVRLHPSEPENKYRAETALLGDAQVEVHPAHAVSLVHDLLQADIVIGIASTALLAGVSLGQRCFAWVPKGQPSVLPHDGVRRCCDCEELMREVRMPAPAPAEVDLGLYRYSFDAVARGLLEEQTATGVR
jgi:hypothetical protein